MRVIGLTGGIACGKSTVSRWLQSQPDCAVIDGDLLSRELTQRGGAALPDLRAAFGEEIFGPEGTLNRRRLGRLVFGNDEARKILDRVMAPHLQRLTHARLEEAKRQGFALCFLDYPLLFEKGYDSLCDSVWCVFLPREIQLARLMARDGCAREEAEARMNAVLSSEEKAARSDTVIDNSGDVSFTLSLLPALLAKERALAEASAPPAAGSRRRRGAGEPSAVRDDPDTNRTGSVTERPAVSVPAGRGGTAGERTGSVMERPAAARRGKSPRKAAWRMPVWLVTLLAVFGFLTVSGVTAQLLMRAYLTRQAEKHLAEDAAIHANYPIVFRDLIEARAAEFNLNPAFVAAIIRNESSFQPRAESSVGARGLMQLMPDTAEWIAGKLKVNGYAFERMYDPDSNIRFGCWYLRYLSNLFRGDPVCVACAYHAGQGQVTAWLSDSRYSDDGATLVLDRMSDGPTKTYAGRVIRTYGIYQALYFTDAVPDADGDPSVSSLPAVRLGQQCGKQSGGGRAEHENPDGSSAAARGAGCPFDLRSGL